jgi:microcystin-dependent protein
MAFASSTFQRVLANEFFTNSSAETQPQTATDGNLIASLSFVRSAIQSLTTLFLPINNPTYTGTLSGATATIATANITTANTTNQNGTLFSQNPSITINAKNYQVGFRVVGEIKMIMTDTAVPNYLNCDGSSYSTTAYPALFTAIGYAYGGSGATFNVPNFASRFPIGNNGSVSGVPSSNYATGNGGSGLTNTQKITYNYLNGSTNTTPILVSVPDHSHQTAFANSNDYSIITPGAQQYLYSASGYNGINTLSTGTGIQGVDPISNAIGVNITPSYIAVSYFICYA